MAPEPVPPASLPASGDHAKRRTESPPSYRVASRWYVSALQTWTVLWLAKTKLESAAAAIRRLSGDHASAVTCILENGISLRTGVASSRYVSASQMVKARSSRIDPAASLRPSGDQATDNTPS